MADGNYAASVGQAVVLTKRCTKCGEEKALRLFRSSRGIPGNVCKKCVGAHQRAWLKTKPIEYQKEQLERRGEDKKRRRNQRKAAGLTVRPWEVRWRDYVNDRAAKGKEYWPSGLLEPGWARHRGGWPFPASAIKCSERAAIEQRKADRIHGRKPWNAPGISEADKFRIRYRMDDDFRARQILKTQTLKAKRAERIAANNDGTVTADAIKAMFAEATICPYCLDSMSRDDKSLDHVQPLFKGGAHSVENIVVCCKPCNFSKGRKSLISWLAGPGRAPRITGAT